MPSVLFVCTANVCRSPMAEVLFRAYLKKARPDDWQSWRVESAGTWANDGSPVSAFSRQVLVRRGLDIKNHRSQTVTAELMAEFDLILTMEAGHKESILAEFPQLAGRVYLLGEMLGAHTPVRDPFGGTLEMYEQTAGIIEKMIAQGFERIADLVSSKG